MVAEKKWAEGTAAGTRPAPVAPPLRTGGSRHEAVVSDRPAVAPPGATLAEARATGLQLVTEGPRADTGSRRLVATGNSLRVATGNSPRVATGNSLRVATGHKATTNILAEVQQMPG